MIRACPQPWPVGVPDSQSIKTNPHKATHGQGEADPSATSRVANPESQATQAWGAVVPSSGDQAAQGEWIRMYTNVRTI